ncbi:spermine synthase [Stenomitos frigidus]|uniref:Polyamine aminopropyltransferase n=1 Tax=Stenomitos frigidus ULC18 TaxID=2107698 RepID=A0A2T1DWT9_9CYAN|nr:spermine synthase [Stenomitos frigidus]PSB24932.1 spermine synthase [Stenomitos frigidus ULC18]
MPTSLFIEHAANGLAFYLNGDLQFDTADEAIYHEHLVVPAIALAAQRFPDTPLRVLICGGGDGLAARDALRFPQVSEVVLVDYSAAVLELGRTVFKPYNQGSLTGESRSTLGADRVSVHTQEAFAFVTALPDACFHAVICDFTFPTALEDTQVYSREWFEQVARVLVSGGVMSTNGVSIERRTLGFWCLYQTVRSATLDAKPMQVGIPSFRRQGYGDWGFLLASKGAIDRSELEALVFPDNLQALSNDWIKVFHIRREMAELRQTVPLHTLASPCLLYYLLNPGAVTEPSKVLESIDFLDLQETETYFVETPNLLELDAIVHVWLEQLRQPDRTRLPNPLLPAQHHYHTPKMTEEGLGYARSLLGQIESDRLLTALLERAKELPPKLAQDLWQLKEKLRSGQPFTYVSEHTNELMIMLMVTLLMANTTTPDAVFAKGSYSSGGSSYGSSGDDENFGWLGFWTMVIGGVWLWNLSKRRDDQ